MATYSGHLEKSQMENVSPENNHVEPPLHFAAISGHLKMENINPENDYGDPPLHLAAVNGHFEKL